MVIFGAFYTLLVELTEHCGIIAVTIRALPNRPAKSITKPLLHALWDSKQEAQLWAELYKTVRPVVGPEKMIEVTSTLLRLQRI